MALVLETDGTIWDIAPANGTDFSLPELYAIVGKPIEIVPMPLHIIVNNQAFRYILVINEEGKLTGLPFNPTATVLYNNSHDYIVGTALLCRENEVQ